RTSEETLRLFDEKEENGKDACSFVFDFIYFLRDVLFYTATTKLQDHLERAIVTESFQALTEKVEVGRIQQAIVKLTECEQQIKWNTSQKVFVEVTLLMIANEQKNEPEVLQQAVPSHEIKQLTDRLHALE